MSSRCLLYFDQRRQQRHQDTADKESCRRKRSTVTQLQADLALFCEYATGLRNRQMENLRVFARQLARISGIRPIGENPERKNRPHWGLSRPNSTEKPDRQLVAERLAEGEVFELSVRLAVLSSNEAIGSFNAQDSRKPAITLSRKEWHSPVNRAVVSPFRAEIAPWDPAPPALQPRWGFGGGGARSPEPNGGSRCQKQPTSVPLKPLQREAILPARHNELKQHRRTIKKKRASGARSKLALLRCYVRLPARP
jgi:hypothetical protein